MNKEAIKSAVLIILVVISLFFTWNMWNLEPTYEEFQNETFFKSVPIIPQETRSTYEVVTPQQLFIHSGEKHYSTLDASYVKRMWKEMQNWEYSNSRSLPKEEVEELIHGKKTAKLELRFFDEIPMETFQSMIEWENEENDILSFDRIYLNVVKDKEIQHVYFVSYSKMRIVESSINDLDGSRFVLNLFSKREEFYPYFAFQTGQGKEILLPENQMKLGKYQYLTEVLDGEKFKDALFGKPRIVKQDVNLSKNRYTDGIRELNIFPAQHMVKFVNPTLRNSNSVETSTLIEQSINYLNDHGGWTDDYVLFDIEGIDQKVTLIMTIQSIPVIPSMETPFGPTMITQRWGQNEIAIYERPLYQLMTTPPSDTTTLMSGRKVVDLIQNNQLLDISQINTIFIAYELGGLENQQAVSVSPVWCIEMKDGTLMKMNEILEQSKEDENGVE